MVQDYAKLNKYEYKKKKGRKKLRHGYSDKRQKAEAQSGNYNNLIIVLPVAVYM